MDSREDFVSPSMMDGNGSGAYGLAIGDGKLQIKLKMQTDCGDKEVTVAEEEEIGKEISKQRVCHICRREFSSGKALGGHMRIHAGERGKKKESVSKSKLTEHQSIKFKNHNPRVLYKDGEASDFVKKCGGISHEGVSGSADLATNLTCSVCGRHFWSQKSLSGHMRQHPERSWRGLRPPSSVEKNGSVGSCLSEDEVPKSDDHVDDDDDDDDDDGQVADRENYGEVDLKEFLMGSHPTDKRGREARKKGSLSSYSMKDDIIHEAAAGLMMLSRVHKLEIGLKLGLDQAKVVRFHDLGSESNVHTMDQSDSVGSRAPFEQTRFEDHDILVGSEDKICLGDKVLADIKNLEQVDVHFEKSNIKLVIKNKKRKKMKLSDHTDSSPATASDKHFKCTTCDRSFSSHQAFGGHMSSHNKVKSLKNASNNLATLINQMEESKEDGPNLVKGKQQQQEQRNANFSSSDDHEMGHAECNNQIHGAAEHVPKTRPQIDLNMPLLDSGEAGFFNC